MSKVTDIIEDLRNIEDLTGPAHEVLVSGDNIKTVGGQSLLGNGDITIGGGNSRSFTASGTIPDGRTVVLNSDGTVSVVSATIEELGSAVVFESASTDHVSVTTLSADKVLIAYRDGGNKGYGTAVVGDITGTSISFGTPVVFESADILSTSTVLLSADRVLIAYRDMGNGKYGTAVVGDITGTSISFGTPVVFESTYHKYSSQGISATTLSADKVLIAYRYDNTPYYGSVVIGTITGSNISFGAPVIFESASTDHVSVTTLSADKVLIAYQDMGNGKYGTAVVGDITGTSISFGTPVVFESTNTIHCSAVSLSADRVLIAYRDEDNNGYGTAVIGDITGTSISFGTPIVFNSRSIYWCSAVSLSADRVLITCQDFRAGYSGVAVVGDITGTAISFVTPIVFNSAGIQSSAVTTLSTGKVLIAYKNNGNSGYGTAVAYQITSTDVQLVLGVSESSALDTDPVEVSLLGNVNTKHTGLVPNTTYYIDFLGDLVPYPTDYGVMGKAISSTEILITKGV